MLERRRPRKSYEEKRKGPDLLVQLMNWVGILGWLNLIVVVVLHEKAKPYDPEMLSVADFMEQRGKTYSVRTVWDEQLLSYAFYALTVTLILGGLGLALNLVRNKRHDDRHRLPLVVLLAISAAGLFYYFQI